MGYRNNIPDYIAAICEGEIKDVKKILDNGIDPNARMLFWPSPLYFAVVRKIVSLVNFLVDRGANPYLRDGEGFFYLHQAASVGSISLVDYFHELLGIDIDFKDFDGNSPLLIAAKYGKTETVKHLISKGADILERNEDGWNSICIFLRRKNYAMADYLLKKVNRTYSEILRGCRDLDWTPPDKRQVYDDPDADKKKDVPLHKQFMRACWFGQLEKVKDIVNRKNKDFINRQYKNCWDCSALHYSGMSGNLETTRFLVEKGVDIDLRDREGKTPLHGAANFGALNVVKFLIENFDIDVDIRNKSNDTPLSLAAREGNFSVVKYLISKGANVNVENEVSWTPLINALEVNSLRTAKILVDAGADVNYRKDDGESVMDYARYTKIPKIVNYIKSRI